MSRTATRFRITSKSEIIVTLGLDGTGLSRILTGVGLYNHVFTTLSRRSLISFDIQASGDVHIDRHHVIEDTAIVLGQALGGVPGDKHGIRCYADATMPLDEALAHCMVDVARRSYVACLGKPEGQACARIGGSGVTYAGPMTCHVSKSLGLNAGPCIHLRFLAGRDPHHIAEAEYRTLARALCDAVALNPHVAGVPSTERTF